MTCYLILHEDSSRICQSSINSLAINGDEMNLFSNIKKALYSKGVRSDKREKLLGIMHANCPYCHVKLEKKPGRKKQCPHCGNFIYVRTRPQDREKVLLREDELVVLEEQWSIVNGTHGQFLQNQARLKSTEGKLRRQSGKEPSKNEVQWKILNDDSLTHLQNKDWGFYRNTRFSMSEILRKEKRFLGSIDLLLEVCLIDLSGPQNCGGIKDPKILRKYPPFDPSMGELVPGIIGRLCSAMEKAEISVPQLKKRFEIVATKLKKSLRLPLNINQSWKELESQFE